MGRQGVALKHRHRLQKGPMPCRPVCGSAVLPLHRQDRRFATSRVNAFKYCEVELVDLLRGPRRKPISQRNRRTRPADPLDLNASSFCPAAARVRCCGLGRGSAVASGGRRLGHRLGRRLLGRRLLSPGLGLPADAAPLRPVTLICLFSLLYLSVYVQ